MDLPLHPTINSLLNALAAVLLVSGWRAIRAGTDEQHREKHRKLMAGAFGTSVLFLISYLIYHSSSVATPFTHSGPVAVVYYVILISHIILAGPVAPLALWVLVRGARGNYEGHKRLARWVFPLWVYVSVTGVLVYLMLYVIFPPAGG
ncbi:MAG: DUF420 domain-containing protein [Deltaproteobacteria bacterium]|nr:DUF420 domain-containing protein [Deltaproteobacteria bacterium]